MLFSYQERNLTMKLFKKKPKKLSQAEINAINNKLAYIAELFVIVAPINYT